MEQISNTENYTADTPISEQSKDRFQRYSFSKRIAETISQRKTADSIVIGIYGDWGEGKTSVLNFIEENLTKDPDIIVCKFNPWRFKDQTQLLVGFFNLLATQLKKSIKTKGEKIGELISDYADVIIPSFSFLEGLIGTNPGEIAKKIAEKYSSVDIEEQKKRIEKILDEEKKRVVIFVDDIDRLDKKEIQTVFKLVKLTGDFSFTSYILAFDEKMVAKAIGEIYEDGGEQAGRNFLEKIIQVPLRLPLAQKEALKKFCFEQVDNALKSNNIDLSEAQARTFVNEFTSNILSRLSTPRVAVRYGNALSFALPLLVKEVNTVDLMLIEAIKVFYPELYTFIRSNPEYFVKSYSSIHIISYDNSKEERKKKCKEEISRISKHYSEKEESAIRDLLVELFPILNEVYHNYAHGEHNYKKWYEEKRIGSPQYFQRYFSYTVIEGEISDIVFEEFLEAIGIGSQSENAKALSDILTKTSAAALVSKLRWNEEKYSPELSKKLALCLSEFGDKFPYHQNSLFGFDTPLGQAAHFIYKLLRNIPEHEQQIEFAKHLIRDSKSFSLTYELMRWFRNDKDKSTDKQIFNFEEFNELASILLDKAISEPGEEPLFEKYPKYAGYLLSHVWASIKGKENLMAYIKPILDKSPAKISDLLKVYSPNIHSSNQLESYYGDIEKDYFNAIQNTFDTDYLYEIAIKAFGKEIDVDTFQRLEHLQTEENRVKQFVYHYKKSKAQPTEVAAENILKAQ